MERSRSAPAPDAFRTAGIGRTQGLGIDPGWNAWRVGVMRWVLRMKREANEAEIDAVLAATGTLTRRSATPGYGPRTPSRRRAFPAARPPCRLHDSPPAERRARAGVERP